MLPLNAIIALVVTCVVVPSIVVPTVLFLAPSSVSEPAVVPSGGPGVETTVATNPTTVATVPTTVVTVPTTVATVPTTVVTVPTTVVTVPTTVATVPTTVVTVPTTIVTNPTDAPPSTFAPSTPPPPLPYNQSMAVLGMNSGGTNANNSINGSFIVTNSWIFMSNLTANYSITTAIAFYLLSPYNSWTLNSVSSLTLEIAQGYSAIFSFPGTTSASFTLAVIPPVKRPFVGYWINNDNSGLVSRSSYWRQMPDADYIMLSSYNPDVRQMNCSGTNHPIAFQNDVATLRKAVQTIQYNKPNAKVIISLGGSSWGPMDWCNLLFPFISTYMAKFNTSYPPLANCSMLSPVPSSACGPLGSFQNGQTPCDAPSAQFSVNLPDRTGTFVQTVCCCASGTKYVADSITGNATCVTVKICGQGSDYGKSTRLWPNLGDLPNASYLNASLCSAGSYIQPASYILDPMFFHDEAGYACCCTVVDLLGVRTYPAFDAVNQYCGTRPNANASSGAGGIPQCDLVTYPNTIIGTVALLGAILDATGAAGFEYDYENPNIYLSYGLFYMQQKLTKYRPRTVSLATLLAGYNADYVPLYNCFKQSQCGFTFAVQMLYSNCMYFQNSTSNGTAWTFDKNLKVWERDSTIDLHSTANGPYAFPWPSLIDTWYSLFWQNTTSPKTQLITGVTAAQYQQISGGGWDPCYFTDSDYFVSNYYTTNISAGLFFFWFNEMTLTSAEVEEGSTVYNFSLTRELIEHYRQSVGMPPPLPGPPAPPAPVYPPYPPPSSDWLGWTTTTQFGAVDSPWPGGGVSNSLNLCNIRMSNPRTMGAATPWPVLCQTGWRGTWLEAVRNSAMNVTQDEMCYLVQPINAYPGNLSNGGGFKQFCVDGSCRDIRDPALGKDGSGNAFLEYLIVPYEGCGGDCIIDGVAGDAINSCLSVQEYFAKFSQSDAWAAPADLGTCTMPLNKNATSSTCQQTWELSNNNTWKPLADYSEFVSDCGDVGLAITAANGYGANVPTNIKHLNYCSGQNMHMDMAQTSPYWVFDGYGASVYSTASNIIARYKKVQCDYFGIFDPVDTTCPSWATLQPKNGTMGACCPLMVDTVLKEFPVNAKGNYQQLGDGQYPWNDCSNDYSGAGSLPKQMCCCPGTSVWNNDAENPKCCGTVNGASLCIGRDDVMPPAGFDYNAATDCAAPVTTAGTGSTNAPTSQGGFNDDEAFDVL